MKRKKRRTGYYWVQWSFSWTSKDDVWRVAYYNHVLEYWTMDGETRTFYDMDFIAIDPRPIPRNWIVGNPSRTWLYLLATFFLILLTDSTIDLYNLIVSLLK